MSKTVFVILAAGEGTRMKSTLPKVLHPIAGLSMLGHVVKACGNNDIAVVVGPNRQDVADEVLRLSPNAKIFVQTERKGTAHALLHARDAFAQGQNVVMLFGDVPLLTSESIAKLEATLETTSVAVLGFEAPNPHGYGRLVAKNGELHAIREEKDASDEERQIKHVNGGPMALRGETAISILERIDCKNKAGEYYVTDAVKIAKELRLVSKALIIPADELFGVNDKVQLAHAENIMQNRLRHQHMINGVTMLAPSTVFLSHDTVIEQNVTIEQNCVFGLKVHVKNGAVIHPFCHLEGAIVGEQATLGPYARLRPGTVLERKAKIGNFVETKQAHIKAGAKVNHLTYIGDAEIGEEANIGAGTITCNYDGFLKYKTIIGKGAFIGSNSSLVAPITIADGAYIGSGSVVTSNVSENALAVARGKQRNIEGWAADFRAKKAKEKAGR